MGLCRGVQVPNGKNREMGATPSSVDRCLPMSMDRTVPMSMDKSKVNV